MLHKLKLPIKFSTFLGLILTSLSLLLAGCTGFMQQGRPMLEGKPFAAAKVERPQAPSTVRHVALLLPMSGALAPISKAIHNGFLAAYYEAHQKRSDIDITVLDTSNQDVLSIYNQAIAKGVDVVVGPLTKKEVAALTNIQPLPVPTLALNTADNYYVNPVANFYQFGLSPQDEALQVAIKIAQDGHHNVAVIAPANAWGQGISQLFQKQLRLQGGQVIANLGYYARDDFDPKIRDFLGVDVGQLQARKKNNQHIQHRQDIDAIFVVANPSAARQIIALLKFYYEGNIALYATSSVYSGSPNPNQDRDLDGTIFCDMPWIIDFANLSPQLQDIRNKINTLWPESLTGSNSRLYALGIDAFNLASNFNELLSDPKAGFNGATGTLFLDNYNHIYRNLSWATFKEGALEKKF